MFLVIVIFGVLTLFAGVTIIIDPAIIFGFLRRYSKNLGLQILAVSVRLVVGILLIYLADISRFPLAIEVLGWLSIIAAITFAIIGRNKFGRLMSWAISIPKLYGRVGGFIAVCFGYFLVYAFV